MSWEDANGQDSPVASAILVLVVSPMGLWVFPDARLSLRLCVVLIHHTPHDASLAFLLAGLAGAVDAVALALWV